MTPSWVQDTLAAGREFPKYFAKELREGKPRVSLLHEGQQRGLWDALWEVRKVPGDLVECGVMHGGASILMALANRAFLDNRAQFMFDSWAGFPPDDGLTYGRMANEDRRHKPGALAADLDVCRENFRRFGLEAPRQHFIKGFFSETTRNWTRPIALLRVDGDLYSSTKEVLENMEPRVSPKGIVIIDDYCFEDCRQAVHEYREQRGIGGNMYINTGKRLDRDMKGKDLMGVWWRKDA